MNYEVIEYVLDKNGNERVSCCYTISAGDYGWTIDRLNDEVRRGRIHSFAITPV